MVTKNRKMITENQKMVTGLAIILGKLEILKGRSWLGISTESELYIFLLNLTTYVNFNKEST